MRVNEDAYRPAQKKRQQYTQGTGMPRESRHVSHSGHASEIGSATQRFVRSFLCWARPGRIAGIAQSLLLGILLAVYSGIARAEQVAAAADSAESVVAIGYIHGDFDDFVAILERTGLIDTQYRWTSGHATLVQTGDLLDRGPKIRQVLDLRMSLQKQAAKTRGRVLILLGNHEVMNLMGDLRYATVTNYASIANDNSEQRRRSAYQEYVKWRKSAQNSILYASCRPNSLSQQTGGMNSSSWQIF